MATAEAKVVRYVEGQLDVARRWYANLHGGALGADDGKPDILTVDADGRLLGIECKAGSATPTYNQWRHAIRILLSGGRFVVAYEDFVLGSVDEGTLPFVEVGRDEVADAFCAQALRLHGTTEVRLEPCLSEGFEGMVERLRAFHTSPRRPGRFIG